jgi:hypothetical protein
VVHGGAQCHQTGADDRQDAHLIWVSANLLAHIHGPRMQCQMPVSLRLRLTGYGVYTLEPPGLPPPFPLVWVPPSGPAWVSQLLGLEQRAAKKIGDPVVGGWIRGQKRTRVKFFWVIFCVFLNSPHRETRKKVIQKQSRLNRFWIFGRLFCKNFSTRFFAVRSLFFVVLLKSHR